jgi:pimeloyl-ACP methyl ester carboxylesterase
MNALDALLAFAVRHRRLPVFEAMTNLASENVVRSARGLAYEDRGAGEPVLLIHGSHVADGLRPIARESDLADHFRLVRYHRRGLGRSAAHMGAFSVEEQARDARSLLAELGIERCHVVGHSYGAITALQLASDAPHAVHSLVLIEPPLQMVADPAEAAERFSPLIALYRSGDRRGAVAAFMNAIGGSDWRATLERTVPGAPEQAERDAPTFFEVELPALQAWPFDREAASRIRQPALFVLGSASGPPFERAKELFLSLVPHAEAIVLPGVNHLMPIQDPRLVAQTVAAFLARHAL